MRFDRARTLLIAGQIQRRAKAKRLAQQLLAEAHREFTAFGAVAWARQVAAELARVNLRPAAAGTLTETERRVAELAAAGLTNREVAQQLFLAVKTVEANLARAYRKLGITSRAGLGALMGPRVPDGLPAPIPLIDEDGRDHAIAAQPGLLTARRDPLDADGIEPEQHHLVPGHHDAAQVADVRPGRGPQRGRRHPHAGLGHTRPVPLHDEPAHGLTVEPPAPPRPDQSPKPRVIPDSSAGPRP
ncbi:MAG: helix-turn-helix transcriptional regulator [Streptosporangiaceae bacterium]|jgi:DNA-binding CsgD family transcriptional regulator